MTAEVEITRVQAARRRKILELLWRIRLQEEELERELEEMGFLLGIEGWKPRETVVIR